MTERDVVAAIRRTHLTFNIAEYERNPRARIHWNEARVDPGDTVFGPGPYLKVPVTLDGERTVHRVYAPARLQRRLRRLWTPSEARK